MLFGIGFANFANVLDLQWLISLTVLSSSPALADTSPKLWAKFVQYSGLASCTSSLRTKVVYYRYAECLLAGRAAGEDTQMLFVKATCNVTHYAWDYFLDAACSLRTNLLPIDHLPAGSQKLGCSTHMHSHDRSTYLADISCGHTYPQSIRRLWEANCSTPFSESLREAEYLPVGACELSESGFSRMWLCGNVAWAPDQEFSSQFIYHRYSGPDCNGVRDWGQYKVQAQCEWFNATARAYGLRHTHVAQHRLTPTELSRFHERWSYNCSDQVITLTTTIWVSHFTATSTTTVTTLLASANDLFDPCPKDRKGEACLMYLGSGVPPKKGICALYLIGIDGPWWCDVGQEIPCNDHQTQCTFEGKDGVCTANLESDRVYCNVWPIADRPTEEAPGHQDEPAPQRSQSRFLPTATPSGTDAATQVYEILGICFCILGCLLCVTCVFACCRMKRSARVQALSDEAPTDMGDDDKLSIGKGMWKADKLDMDDKSRDLLATPRSVTSDVSTYCPSDASSSKSFATAASSSLQDPHHAWELVSNSSSAVGCLAEASSTQSMDAHLKSARIAPYKNSRPLRSREKSPYAPYQRSSSASIRPEPIAEHETYHQGTLSTRGTLPPRVPS